MFFAGLVLAALALVTCQPELLPEEDGGKGEFTDVLYESIGAPGQERIKSVTLYLDGAGVYRTAKQAASDRALGLAAAKMGHDFFEVVFTSGSGTNAKVNRATWRIGQSAGISGVTKGIAYTVGTGGDNAIIFVGKYTSRTLLGVGWLTHSDNNITNTIALNAKSVTFTVSPLKTNIGFNETPSFGARTTFITATGNPPSTLGTNPAYIGQTTGFTTGENREFLPNVVYPLFYLPNMAGMPDTVEGATVTATYTIGGLLGSEALEGTEVPTSVDVTPAILVYGAPTGGVRGGLEVIKRTPALMYGGNWYEPREDNIDKFTSVAATNNITANGAFVPGMTMIFTMTTQSAGIFAITFQVPVFAITIAGATNGGPDYTKWFIRPDYQEFQYLLDNGEDSGGAVLLGSSLGGSSIDWLDIKTQGIGFSNE